MRVIAGSAGGLKLTTPLGTATRPTADRVKEALFSILESAGRLDHARVLDLFAGSGALGIEALSRGADHATFVDKSRPAVEAIHKNLAQTKLSERATVLTTDVFVALDHLVRRGEHYSLILLDPPYAQGLQESVIERLTPLLAPHGLIMAEAAARSPLPEKIGPFCRTDRRIYGDTALEFFVSEGNDAP